MRTSEQLGEIFAEILGSEDRVYYNPPTGTKMRYPAIKYSLSRRRNTFADNKVYKQSKCYEVYVIDANSDSEYAEKVSQLPRCEQSNHYVSENLHHDVFSIYF